MIRDFAIYNNRKDMQGNKLKSLYYLIQNKGEKINFKEYSLINGLNCLEIREGGFIAIKRTHCKEDSFYPCILKTYLFQDLSKII